MPRTLLLLVAALAGACATAAQHDPLTPTAAPGTAAADPDPSSPAGRLALLARGAEALTDDQPVQAIELLERFCELEPDSPMGHFLLGVAHLDLDDHASAREHLVAATALDPYDAGGLAVLARVDYELGRYEDAVASLTAALELEPDAAQHYTSLGLIHFENDQWEAAYEAFLHAVELDPEDLSAHRGLARLYVSAGELALAERAYRTSIVLSPADAGLHVALSHVLRDLGRGEEALAGYQDAQDLEPDNPWIAANLGSTLMELGRFAEARGHFEEALPKLSGVGRDSALILLNYGMLLESLGDLDGAVESMQAAVDADPSLPHIHEALGLLQLDLGREDLARRHLDEAFQLGTLPASTLVELVMLHEDEGDWESALACARAILDHDRTDEALDYRRAQLHLRSRHPDVYDPAVAEALLRPLVDGAYRNHTGSWLLLADVLVERGSLQEALGALDTVLADTHPEDPVFADVTARRQDVESLLAER